MSATTALAAAPDQPGHEPIESNPAEPSAPSPAESAEASPDGINDVNHAGNRAGGESPAPSNTLPPASPGEREASLARIKSSTSLPPVLRERLAALVEANGHAHLPLEACLEALEQSLPDFLRGGRADAAQPPHPVGDVFFRGSTSELSDADAEALAHRQLANSGLLRGQRVQVAD